MGIGECFTVLNWVKIKPTMARSAGRAKTVTLTSDKHGQPHNPPWTIIRHYTRRSEEGQCSTSDRQRNVKSHIIGLSQGLVGWGSIFRVRIRPGLSSLGGCRRAVRVIPSPSVMTNVTPRHKASQGVLFGRRRQVTWSLSYIPSLTDHFPHSQCVIIAAIPLIFTNLCTNVEFYYKLRVVFLLFLLKIFAKRPSSLCIQGKFKWD